MYARRSPFSAGQLVALAGASLLLAGAAAPGWLGPDAASAVRSAFSVLCHQLPDRSPHVGGGVWALCHRCSGIAGGLVLGLAVAPLLPGWLADRVRRIQTGRLIVASLLPMAIDWTLGATGVWANTPESRVATGLAFGAAAGAVLALALVAPPRPSVSPDLITP